MRHEESRYSQDWFRIGDKELKRAQNLFNLRDLEGSGFNIQQAVEKYLKGYLLSNGWELNRVHNLETFLNEIIIYVSSFEEFRAACQKITQYYVEKRYPFTVSSELIQDEVKESLDIAERIIKKIRRLV